MTESCGIDCNTCDTLNPDLHMMAYRVLQRLYLQSGGGHVLRVVNEMCPNLSVCPACRVDDFCHVEGCEEYRE